MKTTIEFESGVNWKPWKQDYRFGSLVFIPEGEIFTKTDELRKKYDPVSADYSMPHMTLTQPFTKAPSKEDIMVIKNIFQGHKPFIISTGPIVTSPTGNLIWVDINPKENFVNLRNELHKTGLFRTDLPFTEGFVPHMTISEFGVDNSETLLKELNRAYVMDSKQQLAVSWVVPNEQFKFNVVQNFNLGK